MIEQMRGGAAALFGRRAERRSGWVRSRRGLRRLPGLLVLLGVAACGAEAAPAVLPELVPGPSPFDYPLSLWDSNVDGTTELMVHVNVVGGVDSVYVERSSGHAAFDSVAVAGARSLRFSPGRSGDRPVPTWTRMPVRFSHDSAAVNLVAPPPGAENR